MEVSEAEDEEDLVVVSRLLVEEEEDVEGSEEDHLTEIETHPDTDSMELREHHPR